VTALRLPAKQTGMCGRYAIITPPEVLRTHFGYAELPNFPPRYNIAPTQPVPVVHLVDGERRFSLMRWGFVPGWVKDLKTFPLVINIRSETARDKASFRAAIQRRRALMPVDGFYEWQKLGEKKQDVASRPFLLRRPDRAPFAFAALWETWASADGSEIDTVALLNTAANGVISAIHARSPVILAPRDYDLWLDPRTPLDAVCKLLQPPADDLLEMVPIGRAINRVAHDGPEVQQPPGKEEPAESPPHKTKSVAAADDQGSLF
jgi:putative SOS response-associated peptidase YedK